MRKQSITHLSHLYLNEIINQDDVMIDATCGRGHDTLFLAKHCKQVYAFDIQKDAIDSTQNLLNEHNINNVQLIHDSHEHFNEYVKSFKGAIFNLGYLPKGDKSITTRAKSTIYTIDLMLNHITSNGFILLVIYPGHLEGRHEAKEIDGYLKTLNHKTYRIIKTHLPYQDNHPPYILWITKT